jgi:hypothetical protein
MPMLGNLIPNLISNPVLATEPLHFSHGLFDTDHQRASDDAVADVQLVHPFDRRRRERTLR